MHLITHWFTNWTAPDSNSDDWPTDYCTVPSCHYTIATPPPPHVLLNLLIKIEALLKEEPPQVLCCRSAELGDCQWSAVRYHCMWILVPCRRHTFVASQWLFPLSCSWSSQRWLDSVGASDLDLTADSSDSKYYALAQCSVDDTNIWPQWTPRATKNNNKPRRQPRHSLGHWVRSYYLVCLDLDLLVYSLLSSPQKCVTWIMNQGESGQVSWSASPRTWKNTDSIKMRNQLSTASKINACTHDKCYALLYCMFHHIGLWAQLWF